MGNLDGRVAMATGAGRGREAAVDTGQLDQVLAGLAGRKTAWARLPIKDKIQYLTQIRQAALANAQRWVDAETKAKQLRAGSPLIGAEAWLGGPYSVVAWLSASIQTLTALDTGADLLAHVKLHHSVDGKLVARVLPCDTYEELLFNGITADVWMQEGVTGQNLRANMAGFYRREDPDGELALVLGAGNVSAIVPLDILDRMINCGEVVICKMNPVNDYLGPIFEDIFAPLIRDGYLAFAYGGADVGEYLTRHDAVQAIHITGSARTFDLIVYGPGEEGQRRKAADDRVVGKPVNSELGGVGATIVLPGPWTEADFRYQADHVVTQKLHNAGHNCVASQVLILPADWDGSAEDAARGPAGPGRLRAEGRLLPRHRGAPERAAAGRAHRRGAGRRRETAVRGRPGSGHRALRVPHRVVRPGHGDDVVAGRRGAVPAARGRLLQRQAVRHAVGEPHRAPGDATPARRGLRPGHRRPAVRGHRDQRVGGCRVSAPPGQVGSLPGAQLHRYPVGHRGGAQRADVRQVAQDRRVRAIPPVPPLDPQRGVHLVPQAAMVPDQ